jgi:hypothetical protein
MSKKSANDEFILDVVRLIEICPRAVAELLLEFGREYFLLAPIEEKLARYITSLEALGPATLTAIGADWLAGQNREIARNSRG